MSDHFNPDSRVDLKLKESIMKWKKVEEVIPPLEIKVLLGHDPYPSSKNPLKNFEYILSKISRPYDQNSMYNPNYYTYLCWDQNGNPIYERLPSYFYWTELSIPEELLIDNNPKT